MARRNARKMWTDHLAGRGSKPKDVNLRAFVEKKPFDGLILGIDPSLRGTGLAVLSFSSGKPSSFRLSRVLVLARPDRNDVGDLYCRRFILFGHPDEF